MRIPQQHQVIRPLHAAVLLYPADLHLRIERGQEAGEIPPRGGVSRGAPPGVSDVYLGPHAD